MYRLAQISNFGRTFPHTCLTSIVRALSPSQTWDWERRISSEFNRHSSSSARKVACSQTLCLGSPGANGLLPSIGSSIDLNPSGIAKRNRLDVTAGRSEAALGPL